MNHSMKIDQIKKLVRRLNQYRHEYYNENSPSVSDATYDHLFDALQALEKETGIILSNSPTQNVGYALSVNCQRFHIPFLCCLWIRLSRSGI